MLGLGSSLISSGAVSEPPRVLIASYNFSGLGGDMDAPGNYVSSELPTNWATSTSGTTFQMYGSTSTNVNETISGGKPTRGWLVGYDTTASTATGPIGGHVGGPDTLSTVVTDGTAIDDGGNNSHSYLVYESSSPASNTSAERRQIVRTGELDFSSYQSIELTFWFNAHGATFGNNLGVGVAVTTSATSASSLAQAGDNLGFTSDTAGGATLSYRALDGSPVSTVRLGHAGQTNTSGDAALQADANDWIKVTADLSAAAGQSSVYIHFGMITNGVSNPFTQDLGIDSIAIIGQ